jgi:hypothetical protein
METARTQAAMLADSRSRSAIAKSWRNLGTQHCKQARGLAHGDLSMGGAIERCVSVFEFRGQRRRTYTAQQDQRIMKGKISLG